MRVLVDTNIVTRSAQPGHPMYQDATDAVSTLRQRGEQLCLVPQNLYEYWAVCTRPAGENGLGLDATEAQAELARVKGLFEVLADSSAIYPAWERLVTQHAVMGRNSHDARLVAAMEVHGVTHL